MCRLERLGHGHPLLGFLFCYLNTSIEAPTQQYPFLHRKTPPAAPTTSQDTSKSKSRKWQVTKFTDSLVIAPSIPDWELGAE